MSTSYVGNEFIMPRPARLQPAAAMPATAPSAVPPVLEGLNLEVESTSERAVQPWSTGLELIHRYSVGTFALLFLMVGAGSIQVGKAYWPSPSLAVNNVKASVQTSNSQQLVIVSAQLESTMKRLSNQSINLSVAGKEVKASPEMVTSWLRAETDKKSGISTITIDQAAINKSLTEIATPHVKAPLNQVSVTKSDGTTKVIAEGRNGTKLGDINPLVSQISPNLLSAKGAQLTLPIETLPFASVTPAAFDKLIEVDVVSKQMWLYEKGQIVKTYPISAGAPVTPTPLGQHKIYTKLSVQDMRGYNADGSQYFQPKVKWIMYFLSGGYGIHGNYWRPQSWFGAVNSSHGCVSLPDWQAKEVYDWAPVGTTVITHS